MMIMNGRLRIANTAADLIYCGISFFFKTDNIVKKVGLH